MPLHLINLHLLVLVLSNCFQSIHTETSFEVILQSSGSWSKDEWIEHSGRIPELKEFTACHWEKLMYFARHSNDIWSYCILRATNKEKLRCLQFAHKGNLTSAYRSVIAYGWLSGWTDQPIGINFPVYSFRHRAWNHFCWSYSSITGINKAYHNGKLIGTVSFVDEYGTRGPSMDRSEDVYESALIIGQEPNDGMKGGYSAARAFPGDIAELHVWNRIITDDEILQLARCKSGMKGIAMLKTLISSVAVSVPSEAT